MDVTTRTPQTNDPPDRSLLDSDLASGGWCCHHCGSIIRNRRGLWHRFLIWLEKRRLGPG